MTKTTKASNRALIRAANELKQRQELAFLDIAPRAYSEAVSRGELVRAIKLAAGEEPSKARLAELKQEAVIGRLTARLPVSAFPKDATETADKMEYVRSLVCNYVSPTVKELPEDKLGRRSETQQKAIRACDEWWSKLMAEIGFGSGKKQSEADAQKKQRLAGGAPNTGANNNPVRGADKASDKPAPSPTQEAMKTPKSKMSPVDACAHVERLASELLAFANKYAAALPTDYGMAVQTFKTSINTAHNSRLEREAASK